MTKNEVAGTIKKFTLTREKLIYILLFLLAALLRFGMLGRVPLVESEAHWAIQAWSCSKAVLV
jgi:hypothetical protein